MDFKELFELRSVRKLGLVIWCIVIAAMLLTARLVYIMIFEGEYYNEKATNIQERERSIKAQRGIIYDRNGVILAGNRNINLRD